MIASTYDKRFPACIYHNLVYWLFILPSFHDGFQNRMQLAGFMIAACTQLEWPLARKLVVCLGRNSIGIRLITAGWEL